MRAARFIVLFFVIFSSAISGASASLPADETRKILEEADLARGDKQGAVWLLQISTQSSDTESNQMMKVSTKNYNTLTETLAPKKSRGQKVLMVDRNVWFLKPGLRKPVPLSARQRLLGSASYGDIASTNYTGDYNARFVESGSLEGKAVYVFELTAKPEEKPTYAKIRYWVTQDSHLGIKAEFFSQSGKLVKTAKMNYENTVTVGSQKRAFISRMTLQDANTDSVTTLNYGKVNVTALADSLFHLNALQN